MVEYREGGLIPDGGGSNLWDSMVILENVAFLHESTITEETPLDTVGPYTSEQVRRAFALVGTHIIKTHTPPGHPALRATKPYADGELRLGLASLISSFGARSPRDAKSLVMSLRAPWPLGSRISITSEIPLVTTPRPEDRIFIGFSDKGKHISLRDLTEHFTLPKYRFMWRGIRWTATNMLIFNMSTVVLPGEIDDFLRENRHLLESL